jgi:hypothetical protein
VSVPGGVGDGRPPSLPEDWRPPPALPDELITCIDCGGRCHLLVNWAPDNPPRPGDVVAYRCEECLDRWDIVVPDESEE